MHMLGCFFPELRTSRKVLYDVTLLFSRCALDNLASG